MTGETMPTRRLTRQESQQRTRERLMDAAAREFVRNGFGGTSIEQIVERAGYTRGAFYSNFDGLEELLLAIMDERLAGSQEELAAALSESEDLDAALVRLREHNQARPTRSHTGAFVLTMEFWLHAMRDRRVKRRLARHYQDVRQTFATVIDLLCAKAGVMPPAETEQIASVLLAIDNGLQLQRLVDDTVVSEDLYQQVMGAILEWYVGAAHPSPDKSTVDDGR